MKVTISNSLYCLWKLCIQNVLSRLIKHPGFHLLETWGVEAKHSWEIYDTMASKLQHMSATPREFTLQYLEHITDSFSKDHIIGRGEHGVVYKGVLDNGEEIALKKLYHMPEIDDTQFRIELNNLVRARHPNIIRLIGYCCNIGHKRVKHNDEYTSAVVEERFLCFEYLQGESLDNYISDESCALDWLTCFKIIKGVCEGLNYLHNGTNDHIFHLHLKPSNILLDKNMMPKIGDFVYSRLFSSAKICVTAKAIEQTWRYKPPEYIYKGETTSKFDIFSLGVIIIEVMARFIGYSRRADMPFQELLDLVHLNWKKKLVAMTSCETSQQFRVCLEIALRCLEDDQMNRPAIAEIIKELNKLNTAESSFTGEAEMEDRGSEWLQAAMELPVSASLGPIGSLFRKLHSFKDTNESLPAGVSEGEIHSLKKELEELCTSLMDLSEANDTSFTAKYWMKEVREVCYDIENYFDKLIMQPSNGSNVRWIHKLLKRQPQMAIDFSTLVARVADARERRGRLVKWNIEQESGQASTAPAIASSSTLSLQQPVQVACVRRPELTLKLSVPAAAHMDDLVNLLAFDDEKQKRLKVVSIFGYAGVGKTTVARILYRKFGGKFDCRAFVRMSRQPDIRRLLTSMLSQIKAPPANAFADVQVLVGIIRTHLEHKRYFLIIDELWTPSVWNTIRRAFPDGNYCSRVIIATENEDAALACSSYQSKYIFKMRSVSGYQTIELLSSGVYDSVRSSHQDFKELSYGVITTSGGLPLASLNTGSISEPNLIRQQWEQIQDSLASTLSANPTCEVMEEVINLIYNSLPHHLKTCLLYLNVYPEGYTIWKYVLVGQWIAEGFIGVTRKKKGFVAAVKQQDTKEEDNIKEKVRVAQGYFVQLACRGMIQAVDTNAKGEVLSCTVHHMVLDLIRRKCMEDNFITTMDKFPSTLVFPDMVRRLSIQFGDAKVAKLPENMTYSQVQSLIYFGSFECAPSTGDYRFLRVLNLHIWADQDKTIDLTTISELFWLKYFKVDCNTTVNLPATVRMLQNLGTLEVDAPLSVVPSDIFSLKSLLHLSLPSQVNLPDGIVDMTSLRSLRYFSLSTNSADNVLGLGKLIKLWDLRVTCSTVKAGSLAGNMKHFGSILGEFKELQSLIMESETSNVNISCDYLSSVSCAPALLERVEFPRTFIFPSLPKWFGDLEKLTILKVTVRETSTEDIDILKGLNALTSLSICVSITPEARIVFDKDGFTLLRYFKFTSGALCLTFDLGAMPNIERLKLRFDAKFFEQSDLRQAGIENLLGLKEVSAKIGILGANESDTKAALLMAIFRTHPSSPIFNVQSVDRTFDEKSTVRYEEKHQTTQTQDVHVGTTLFDSRSTVAPETSLPMQIIGEVTHDATYIETTLEATFSKPPEEHLITAEISEEGFNEQHEIHVKDCQEDDKAQHDSRNSPPRSSIISNLQDPGEVGDKVTHTEYPLEPKFIKLPEEHPFTYEISNRGFGDECASQEKNTTEDDNTQATRTYAPPGSISYPHDPHTEIAITFTPEEKDAKKVESKEVITMEDGTLASSRVMHPALHRPLQTNQMATSDLDSDSKLYELKEQLVLLTTLVATVTYLSGLNQPGGDWKPQQEGGHVVGDPIRQDTHYHRYLVFHYCNAMAFVSSLVVCLILVMLRRNSTAWTVMLWVVMEVDLLAMIGSYAGGACSDIFTTIFTATLDLYILGYNAYTFRSYFGMISWLDNITNPRNTRTAFQEKEKIEVSMLLATFVFTISYTAGLNPPGGFWSSTQQQEHGRIMHLAGNPIMQGSSPRRYHIFFVCNTTAMVASLLVILSLLYKKLSNTISARFVWVHSFIAVALLGLMGSYAAGSCRETDDTVKVISLAAAVPACLGLQLALSYLYDWKPIKNIRRSFYHWTKILSPAGDNALEDPVFKNTCYLAMVLASFAVCITYQSALNPPGGLWQDNLDGHSIGHPVLQTTHPTRYWIFFYSNSAVFVTSVLVVMMIQSKFLLTLRTLVASIILDLIGLVITYAAGIGRDDRTSIYLVAMFSTVFIYALVVINLRGVKENVVDEQEQLEDKRQVLLLIAILVAALTYQAGLTPPGGFWPWNDDKLGHRAGYPVLLDTYPRRYTAFLYCNATSFTASVATILSVVSHKLYMPALRGNVLYGCMAVGMFALMGAYASGSSRDLKNSIYVISLVVAVGASLTLLQVYRYISPFRSRLRFHDEPRAIRQRVRGQGGIDKEKDVEIQYLMLLGILGASVTYQSGLRPPGGMWHVDSAAYSAGYPVLHDVNKRRYDIFLYSNSASFMASVVAIVMLLPLTLTSLEWLRRCLPFHAADLKWPLWPVYTAILLDMLGLLVAYTAGSTRDWESTRNVICMIVPILLYIAAYPVVAIGLDTRRKHRPSRQSSSMQAQTNAAPV